MGDKRPLLPFEVALAIVEYRSDTQAALIPLHLDYFPLEVHHTADTFHIETDVAEPGFGNIHLDPASALEGTDRDTENHRKAFVVGASAAGKELQRDLEIMIVVSFPTQRILNWHFQPSFLLAVVQ